MNTQDWSPSYNLQVAKYWVGQTVRLFFFHKMVLAALCCLTWFEAFFLDCTVTAVISACIKKKTNIKIGEFLCSHFNIEDGRKKYIFRIVCLIISRKEKMQLKCKNIKRSAQCMEMVLWLTECIKSGFCSFVLEISCWMIFHGQVDQVKLTATKSRH